MPEGPQPILATASAGGGASAKEGVSGMLHNPATLSWRGGGQAELGFLGLSEGYSPYALFGWQKPDGPTGGAGAWRYTLEGYSYYGFLGAFAWPIWEGGRLGLAVQGSFAKGEFGTDIHAGWFQELSDHWEIGFFTRNVLATGIGNAPDGLKAEREWQTGLGQAFESAKVWRLHFHELGWRYDLGGHSLSPTEWHHSLSGNVFLPPSGTFGLHGGLKLTASAPTPEPSFGFSLRLPLGGARLQLTYAFSPGSKDTAHATAAVLHSMGLHLDLAGRQDVIPPSATADVIPHRISVLEVKKKGVYFKLWAEDPDGAPASWKLSISLCDSTGHIHNVVKQFTGNELPPRLIRWDGVDDEGHALMPGIYTYEFAVKDRGGNTVVTLPELLEITENNDLRKSNTLILDSRNTEAPPLRLPSYSENPKSDLPQKGSTEGNEKQPIIREFDLDTTDF